MLTINLETPLALEDLNHINWKELRNLDAKVFFPNDEPFGEYFQGYLESGNMAIFMDKEDRLVIQTDYNSYPDYRAFWKISVDRRMLNFSHTCDDL
jgi:hypothetical protein